MNDRPTPRTDAKDESLHGNFAMCYGIMLEHARTLERELAELRELYDLDTQTLRADRDEARDELVTVNAERAETRDLRKAWIDADNQRQKLQAENAALRDALRVRMDMTSSYNRVVCPECKVSPGHSTTCRHYQTEREVMK